VCPGRAQPAADGVVAAARDLAEAHHAREYRQNAGKPKAIYDASAKAKFMGVCFTDWRETARVEVSGPDEGPIQIAPVDLSKLSDDDLRALERLAGGGLGRAT
jgi:hypothetical protein